eukprot:1136778-Pelagomonas_calceolata.AAC.2
MKRRKGHADQINQRPRRPELVPPINGCHVKKSCIAHANSSRMSCLASRPPEACVDFAFIYVACRSSEVMCERRNKNAKNIPARKERIEK